MQTFFIHRLRLALPILRDLFLTDPKRTAVGRLWQLLSRFTWELPQTLVGCFFTLSRALAGGVDRVDVLGGITFASGKARRFGGGVSLGSFIDLWLWREMRGKDEAFVLSDPLCMHEFGHTADSQRFTKYFSFLIFPYANFFICTAAINNTTTLTICTAATV